HQNNINNVNDNISSKSENERDTLLKEGWTETDSLAKIQDLDVCDEAGFSEIDTSTIPSVQIDRNNETTASVPKADFGQDAQDSSTENVVGAVSTDVIVSHTESTETDHYNTSYIFEDLGETTIGATLSAQVSQSEPVSDVITVPGGNPTNDSDETHETTLEEQISTPPATFDDDAIWNGSHVTDEFEAATSQEFGKVEDCNTSPIKSEKVAVTGENVAEHVRDVNASNRGEANLTAQETVRESNGIEFGEGLIVTETELVNGDLTGESNVEKPVVAVTKSDEAKPEQEKQHWYKRMGEEFGVFVGKVQEKSKEKLHRAKAGMERVKAWLWRLGGCCCLEFVDDDE
ncbi:hypothetical protein HDU76_010911, partial [Blyttiomyces sp. JEL0837]